ncbi:nuclear transport factor 2 family protein [Fulvivirga sp. 29W222]|uniref:Nuclear transport factor 2 family protein n=1 Tax=Fulvivirga marina TaxID=2494733 RepID=A0A937FVH0_9BACT|nr:nuclear transport factor 2 family protein [Fulvivirga marina]MBL6445223.1 nuclear transport factor 2 family protein [Fulvivirga marina]
MRKIIIPVLFCFLLSYDIYAQNSNTEEKAVLDVVEQLFDGMRAADSAMVHAVFYNKVEFYTAFTNKEGKRVLHEGALQGFLDAVGSPHDVIWDELIWDTEIRIDGNLAQVWTKYAFYAGDKFSHCGVDSFHLFKSEVGWKIFHLTDTREWKNCNVPDDIKEKHKKNP